MKNADVVNLLLKDPTTTERTCTLCDEVVKQKKQSGYKNLLSHLQGHHAGFEAVAEECAKKNCPPISTMFVHKDAAGTYGWAKLVALKNFPFAHVDDPVVRDAVRYKSMDRSTLLKRMTALVGIIDLKISAELVGEKFALVFDGFTDSAEHAISIFVATKKGLRVLAFSPFVDEASLTAAEHIQFLDLVLTQYSLRLADMVAIVADNMETNRAISRRIEVPLVGCAAHRFNLAVRQRLEPHMKLIKKVSALMRKIKTVKRIAKLKQNGCDYKPVPLHELRWSGCYRMLQRYEDYRPYLHLFREDCDVDRDVPVDTQPDDIRRTAFVDLIPSAGEERKISALLDEMTAFDVITGKLQRQDMTVATVRDIFDVVLEDYANMEKYLTSDADIVECPDFERGLAKVQAGMESSLPRGERRALYNILADVDADTSPTPSPPARNNSKRKRAAEELDEKINEKVRKRAAPGSRFIDVSWVPATSVVVESNSALDRGEEAYLRKSMSESTLETVMFLKLNWDLVMLVDVSKAIENSRGSARAAKQVQRTIYGNHSQGD